MERGQNTMNKKAFNAAKEALQELRDKLLALKLASTDGEKLSSWKEFLSANERVFIRLAAATESCDEAKGWFRDVKKERDGDELLTYLHHARHVREHGLQRVILKRKPTMLISPAAPGKMRVQTFPAAIQIVAVVDRGVRYPVPKHHLGKSIQPYVTVIAEMGLVYIEAKVAEAEAKWGG